MCLEDVIRKKVLDEFDAYKKDVLKCNNPEVVWDLCNRIAFFSCVAEYFEFMETIPEEYLEVLDKHIHPIYAMWTEYLKYEQLRYAKWEDIENILHQMAERESEERAV